MSLRPQQPGASNRPLYGVDEISLPQNAVLIFSHPAVRSGPLYIYSGATAIQWAYHLNTQSTPTIGGEVVQILSASAGPMNISGQSAGLATNKTGRLDNSRVKGWKDAGDSSAYGPNHELKAIVAWFREYMEVAGSTTRGNIRRDERAIDFKYPERNWHFKLQVTAITGFRYDKSVIAPEWSITAEIVSDNALDYFSGVTMASFTDDLISNTALIGQIGLSSFGGTGTETSNSAFGNTGDFASTDPFLNPVLSQNLASAKKFGDNFQHLVASWSAGDNNFIQGAFGALLDNGANPQNVDQVYQSLFGSNFVGGPGSGGNTGMTGDNLPTTSVAKGDIAQAIAQSFDRAGIPGYLAVADALVESQLNPDARSPDDGGTGIDGVGLFQTHCPGGSVTNASVKTASSIDRTSAVTKNYSVGQQIADAVGWWTAAANTFGVNLQTATVEQLAAFAAYAQKPADPEGYAGKVNASIGIAQQLLAGAAPTGSLRATIVNWAQQFVQKYQGSYSQTCRRDVESIAPGDYSALPTSDCSNTVALFYSWGTGNDRRYGTNGTRFNSSTTDTIWNTAREITASQAKAADFVVFGNSPSTSKHVVMLMENYSGDATPCFSFGTNPPTIGPLSSEITYFSDRGYGAHYFTRLP